MNADNPTMSAIGEDIVRFVGKKTEQIRPFAAGHGADLYLADMKDGSRVVAKQSRQSDIGLDTEGWMLRYLSSHSELPVPRVYCAEPSLLVMDYVPDSGRVTGAVEADAAVHLSKLHAVTAKQFGLERDTVIGPFEQINTQEDNWVVFFRDTRLMNTARIALEEGSLPPILMQKIEKLAGRLDRWIDNRAQPALIHGDLWGGNVLTGSHGINAFIDPAIYYADREMELAFIALFSTFGDRFFRHYHELAPIEPGFFEVRKDIYALYPLLIHARQFGGAYLEKINQIVTGLV